MSDVKYKCIDSIWFGNIGIVAVYPITGSPTYRIGVSDPKKSKEQNIRFVMEYGQSVNREAVTKFLQSDGTAS